MSVLSNRDSFIEILSEIISSSNRNGGLVEFEDQTTTSLNNDGLQPRIPSREVSLDIYRSDRPGVKSVSIKILCNHQGDDNKIYGLLIKHLSIAASSPVPYVYAQKLG